MTWRRFLLVLLVAVLGAGLALSARAGNTSKRTGKGAIHDDSVYCQNWPGHAPQPPYDGTGPQTPCGPNFERPAPPPPPADPTGCPARQAALVRPGLLLAATAAPVRAHGLWVAGRKVTDPRQVSLASLSAIRQEILQAMICSPHRVFEFADANELAWTVELRVRIMALMRALSTGGGRCQFMANGGIALPGSWETYPDPRGSLSGALRDYPSLGQVKFAMRAKAGVGGHAAVQGFRTESSLLDCLAGMELTILDAADGVLTERNFDAFHQPRAWPRFAELAARYPDDAKVQDAARRSYALIGLGIPLLTLEVRGEGYTVLDNRDKTSLGQHLVMVRYHAAAGARGERSLDRADDPMAGAIATADLIPGDYAYLSNLPDYETRAPSGPWAGENAFYLGKDGDGSGLFYGYGFYDPEHPERSGFLTEDQLKRGMAEGYNATAPARRATAAEMQWTRLGGPTLYGDPRHAGLFERQSR